jgi:hypothetical protein
MPGHPLVRPLVEFVMADLAAAGRPLHWRDCAYAWNHHIARTRQLAPYDDDLFLSRLAPAIQRRLIICSWDEAWAAMT